MKNRNHPVMHVLMLLRNKNGQGTKLEEGYITNPDFMCLALYLHASEGLTAKDAEQLGQEWRFTSLAPVFMSNDRCHALNYEATQTWGAKPNVKKPTPLYFFPDPKRQKGRAKRFFLTKVGEARAKDLMKVIMSANTDYERPIDEHSNAWLPGMEVKLRNDVAVMSHFRTTQWGVEVTDFTKSSHFYDEEKRFGTKIEGLDAGRVVTVLSNIQGDVCYVRTPSGKEGFLNSHCLVHPLDVEDDDETFDAEG